ncbi:hypothetical protein QBC37DRAFT_391574 [Rhypophila decipiens]|uniref:C2H2-type domain-containing protein n=1 Tax=Rhypophila decipiens TaxID=261697 RepID=A0AAN6XXY8_9PEZI|nr:hypothetical protein QBC37DRAFT_391574 [Rhypophila decipiens]
MLKQPKSEQVPNVDKSADGLSVGSLVGMGASVLVISILIVSILALYTSPRNTFRTRQSRFQHHGSRTVPHRETLLESAIGIPQPPPACYIAPRSTVEVDEVPVHRSSVQDVITIPSSLAAFGSPSSQVTEKDAPRSSCFQGGINYDCPDPTTLTEIAVHEDLRTSLAIAASSDVKLNHPQQGEGKRSPVSDLERSSEEGSSSGGSLSISDTSTLGPTLEIYKKRAVDSLMTEFKSLLSHGPHLGLKIRAGGREQRTEEQGHSSNSSSEGSITASKRGRATSDCIGLDDSPKRPKLEELCSSGLRFACPFYKRNPKRHLRHRACSGPGWGEVRRVKEHLYRTHAVPIHCHRCGTILKSETDLRNHQRQPEGCEIKLVDLPEGFDKAQEAELRKKKHGETEEERWYAMYKILFPDEDGDLVPSPYHSNSNSPNAEQQRVSEIEQYERFQRRELLRVVRRLLQDAVSGMAGPLEDQLRTQFVGIIRQAQSEVFQAYRGSMGRGTTKSKDGGIENSADSNNTNLSSAVYDVLPAATHSVQIEAQSSTANNSSIHTPTTGYCGEINTTPQSAQCNDFSPAIGSIGYGNPYIDLVALESVLDMGSTTQWATECNYHAPVDSQRSFLTYSRNGRTEHGEQRFDISIFGPTSSHLIDGHSMWGSQDTSASSTVSTDFGNATEYHHANGNAQVPGSPSGDDSWRPSHLGSFIRLDY